MARFIVLILFSLNLYSQIKLDGKVDAAEWQNSEKYTLDYEIEPSYNGPAEHKTEAFVKHDDSYLYVAFKAYGNKDYIRAQVRSRDSVRWSNDITIVGIDTYGDGRYYIGFGVNPLGSIHDFKRIGNGEPDSSYNVEFEGEGRLTDFGYEVEMKIPFSSLIFPEEEKQEWKLMFFRKLYNRAQESRYLSHPVIAGAGCSICQSNITYNLFNIEKKQKRRLIPSFTANSLSNRDSEGNLKSESINSEVSLGGDFEIFGSNFEFTLNPDFSQIEADETKIDINQTTALQFEERRIFFNEGKDYLSSRLDAVYTRAINDPEYAIKFFNRGEKHSYFFLDAKDRNTPLIVPGEQRSYSALLGESNSNIFSYNYNLGKGQNLGFLATNRTYEEGGFGRLYSAKGKFLLSDKYSTYFEIAQSSTEEPISDLITTTKESDKYNYLLDGESFDGTAAQFNLNRNTEKWETKYRFETKSPEFRTDLGFTTENNWLAHELSQSYQYRSNNFIRKANMGGSISLLTNYDNNILDQEAELFFNADFSNQINLDMGIERSNKATFEGFAFHNIDSFRTGVRYNPSGKFFIRFNYDYGDAIARNISTPELGKRTNYTIGGFYQVNDRIRVRYNYRYNKLENTLTNKNYFAGYLTTIRGLYQFDKNSFIRVVQEYNDFNDNGYTQLLFQWQPNSATIFYFGGTFNQEDIEGTWEIESSQIYMKFQYLFNFD